MVKGSSRAGVKRWIGHMHKLLPLPKQLTLGVTRLITLAMLQAAQSRAEKHCTATRPRGERSKQHLPGSCLSICVRSDLKLWKEEDGKSSRLFCHVSLKVQRKSNFYDPNRRLYPSTEKHHRRRVFLPSQILA